MSPESDGIFIDTNILIYSTFPDFDSEKHIQSLESLNQLLQSGKPLFVSSQILREYFAISTNGSIFKRPLNRKQAAGKIHEFLRRFNLILEKETTIQTLMDLIEKYTVSRQKIHEYCSNHDRSWNLTSSYVQQEGFQKDQRYLPL